MSPSCGVVQGCARRPRSSFEAMARSKIHVAFEIGVILKGLNGLLELIGGVLLLHGVIKAVLVYALIKDELWAFPWAIGVFGAFGIYQMYRYIVDPSGWLI